MKIAIIGLPGSGKSAFFTAVTGRHPDEKEALKPHLGTVFVPDERLDNLARILNPKKLTHAEITFLDTHSLDLVHSKEADGLIIVIGVFSEGSAKKDGEKILTSLMLSDFEIIENRLPRMKKEIEAGKRIKDQPEYNLLLRCKEHLEKNRPLKEMVFAKEEEKMLHGYQFLSLKPAFFVANISEDRIGKGAATEMRELAEKEKLEVVELCAKIEEEILELAEEERLEFLKGLGINELSQDRIVKTAYKNLGLISFFTVKGDETKSWPIKKGAHAIDAAGKVHTDIQKGFIKAEVINYKDFVECGDFNEAKKRGLLKLEGRDYVVNDGDIINFKFNV
jgi:ribosome-binding ATPase